MLLVVLVVWAGLCSFAMSTMQVFFFGVSSARQTEKLRNALLTAILRQEVGSTTTIQLPPSPAAGASTTKRGLLGRFVVLLQIGWFDTNNGGELATVLSE